MGIALCWWGGDGWEPVGRCGRGPFASPRARGAGERTQLDARPASAQGHVCV